MLQVAKKLFARQGYDKTSVADIVRELNIYESQLYRLFKGKGEILNTIFDMAWARIITRSQDSFEADDSCITKVEKVVSMIVDTLEQDRDLEMIFLLEGRRAIRGVDFKEVGGITRLVNLLDTLLREAQQDGILKNDVSDEALQALRSALIGALEGMTRDRVYSRTGRFRNYPAKYSNEDIKRTFRTILESLIAR